MIQELKHEATQTFRELSDDLNQEVNFPQPAETSSIYPNDQESNSL